MEFFVRPPIEVISYTAGFFDGEGSIWFTPSCDRFNCSLSQSEVNDGEHHVRRLREEWGIGLINCQKKGFRGRKWNQWHWSMCPVREVRHFLVTCLPYLRVKRAAAERAIAHCDARIATGVRVKFAPGEDQYIREHWREEDAAVALVLGRSTDGIKHRRRALGLPRKPHGGIANLNRA